MFKRLIQNSFIFFPELSDVEEIDGVCLARTVTGVWVTGFQVSAIDLESKSLASEENRLIQLLKALHSDVTVRVIADVHDEFVSDFGLSRDRALQSLGRVKRRNRIFIESESKERLIDSVRECEGSIKVHRLNDESLHSEFERVERTSYGVPLSKHYESDGALFGVCRLTNVTTSLLNEVALSSVLMQIPRPFRIVTTMRRLSRDTAVFRLKAAQNRLSVSSEASREIRYAAIRDAITSIDQDGEFLFTLDLSVILERNSDGELRGDLRECKRLITGSLGECVIDSVGTYASLIDSSIGGGFSPIIREVSPQVIHLLPVCSFGESEETSKSPKSSLLLHRRDESVHFFDLFNPKFSSSNAIIAGRTGSGKSVFGNILTSALMHDENIEIVKIDVGGSYKRECERYQGEEIQFSMDKACGVDPFRSVSFNDVRPECISVMSEFISSLLLETGEMALKKELSAKIEGSVSDYLKTGRYPYSMSEFVRSAKTLERVGILTRWIEGGAFENAFKDGDGPEKYNSRYIYYNFQSIFAAGNTDFAAGLIAAVVARLNMRLLDQSNTKRLVLYCDEVKFFIEKHRRLFLLTSANFRKFGHALLTIFQNIKDARLVEHSNEDLGLILNSPIRILFETNAETEFLSGVLGLTDSEVSVIKNPESRPAQYREFLIQDDLGTRVCALQLTTEEYWGATSTKREVDMMNGLMSACPWLTRIDAIEICAGYVARA